MQARTPLQITSVIDERISPFQVRVFILCALVVFLDGVDTQIIGIAAPLLSNELGVARDSLGVVFAAGTLGATFGALVCGMIADRVGRRATLIAATIVFGIGTIATACAASFESLVLLRLLTGLGLGGAVPCFVALTSEYAPSRRRATIISLLWAAFPLGGMVGGLLNAYVLHELGWRPLFYVWGAVPIAVAALHLIALPESPRFLLGRSASSRSLSRILIAISPGSVTADTRFAQQTESRPGFALGHIFAEGRLIGTLSLTLISFIVFGSLVVVASWTPTLLTPLGISPSSGALVVALNGMGSFLGTSAAGRLMERYGVTRCVIPGFVLAIGAYVLFGASQTLAPILLASLLAGVFLGLCSSCMVALAALIYPTEMRSTGIGWAMGMGRFGAVIGPLAVGAAVGLDWSVAQIFAGLGLAALIAIPCVIGVAAYQRRAQALLDTAIPDISTVRP